MKAFTCKVKQVQYPLFFLIPNKKYANGSRLSEHLLGCLTLRILKNASQALYGFIFCQLSLYYFSTTL